MGNPSGVTYRLVIASDPDFSTVLLTKALAESEYVLSEEEKLLPGKSPLYWRARAEKGSDPGAWSLERPFYVSSVSAIPGWAKYSLAGLGLVLLCFVCFWIGSTRVLRLRAETGVNEREDSELL